MMYLNYVSLKMGGIDDMFMFLPSALSADVVDARLTTLYRYDCLHSRGQAGMRLNNGDRTEQPINVSVSDRFDWDSNVNSMVPRDIDGALIAKEVNNTFRKPKYIRVRGLNRNEDSHLILFSNAINHSDMAYFITGGLISRTVSAGFAAFGRYDHDKFGVTLGGRSHSLGLEAAAEEDNRLMTEQFGLSVPT